MSNISYKELTLEERCKWFELHYPEAECDAQYTKWYRDTPEDVLDIFNIPNRITLEIYEVSIKTKQK